ncbi:MAG: phosphatase [Clostridiales bacterium]|jgi:putative hydrolase|nr:phosphatase [Clostridiales bacterium]
MTKILLDTHVHTISSGHAYSTILECIDQAFLKKLDLIAITDHGPLLSGSTKIHHFGNLKSLPRKIKRENKILEVLYGVEANIINYSADLDLPNGILDQLDIIIASLHHPCIRSKGDNTDLIISVLENKRVNILGHPNDLQYLFDIKKVVDKAKETDTIIEINNSTLKQSNLRFGARDILKEILLECKKKSCYVILSSDAHFALDIAELDLAIDLLKEIKFPDDLVLNTSTELFKNVLNLKK